MIHGMVYTMAMIGTGIYCLTGRAGAGKTTLANTIRNANQNVCVYSADWRFIGDSQSRRQLLARKQATDLISYQDACNQYNWWNWNLIIKDLSDLANNGRVTIEEAYDRDTGGERNIVINPAPYILFESAIPGPCDLVGMFRKMFYLDVPADIRLQRLVQKDKSRRNVTEIAARFLVTEYSESVAYMTVNNWFPELICLVNEKGDVVPGEFIPSAQVNYIPLQVGGMKL